MSQRKNTKALDKSMCQTIERKAIRQVKVNSM